MATLFVDYENGNDNYGGTSFALLGSGTDGAISSVTASTYATFTSASANFANDNTIAPTKNLAWYSNSLYHAINIAGSSVDLRNSSITAPSAINASVFYVVEGPSSNQKYLETKGDYTPFAATTQYTISIYARAGERNKLILRLDNDAKTARYNLSTGAVEATGGSATASITNVGSGWYRLSLTATTTSASDKLHICIIPNSDNSSLAMPTYQGDGVSGLYICGLQIEQSASATTYEKPPEQALSIFNGSSYIVFYIAQRISSTSLRVNIILGGTALSTQSARQYFVGGRWKTLTSGASAVRIVAGDTIRVMGSPNPTSIGNATWTSNILQSTKNITSSTSASPININISAHGYVTGDTVVITGHLTNTNANGTWTITRVDANNFTLNGSTGSGSNGAASGTVRLRTNTVVTLASSVTQNVASCGNRGEGRTAWTQSSNIAATLNTSDYKEGDCSDSIDIAAAFTTGLAAYKATGTLDLSGYQQLSFWIKQTAGTIGATGAISLALCSDTVGAVPVNTFNIENLTVLNRWTPITIDLGTNLGSSIRSIAFYVNTDNGAQTFLVSNIIACKASSSSDSLSLQSLIGKNISTDTFYAIQSINGSRVMLDQDPTAIPTSTTLRGYCDGTVSSSLVATFKRETIKTVLLTTANSASQTMTDSSFLDLPIIYEGGWDRTNMSTQNLETWFDGRNGLGYGLYYVNAFGCQTNKLSFIRYSEGMRCDGGWFYTHSNSHCNNNSNGINCGASLYRLLNNFYANNSASGGTWNTGSKNTVNNNYYLNNNSNGINIGTGGQANAINNTYCYNNGVAINMNSGNQNICSNCIFNLNSTCIYLQNSSGYNKFISCSTSNNASSSISTYFAYDNFCYNCTFNEATFCTTTTYFGNSYTYSQNHNNTPSYVLINTEGGTIFSTPSIRYSNSGIAWALSPTSTLRSYIFPLNFKIATTAVNANSLVIVRAWMRRTNTGLNTGLRIKGGQIAGVSSDITSYMSAAADTWEQVTLSFTPTEAGVVEILAECFGGSTFTAYVDDISITQV